MQQCNAFIIYDQSWIMNHLWILNPDEEVKKQVEEKADIANVCECDSICECVCCMYAFRLYLACGRATCKKSRRPTATVLRRSTLRLGEPWKLTAKVRNDVTSCSDGRWLWFKLNSKQQTDFDFNFNHQMKRWNWFMLELPTWVCFT